MQLGQKWPVVGAAVRNWILNDAAPLADGRHRIEGVPGIPFAFDARKGGAPQFNGVLFSRYAPDDVSLAARMKDQLVGRHDKLTVLGRHRDDGKRTLLLLESADAALMNPVKMIEALEAAFPVPPAELDEVWLMHRVEDGAVNVHNLTSGETWIFETDACQIRLHNPLGPKLGWAI